MGCRSEKSRDHRLTIYCLTQILPHAKIKKVGDVIDYVNLGAPRIFLSHEHLGPSSNVNYHFPASNLYFNPVIPETDWEELRGKVFRYPYG